MSLANNLHYVITLNSDRKINLERLEQRRTYWSVLEGTPNADINDGFVKSAMRRAQRSAILGGCPVLIPPQRRDFHSTPGDSDHTRKKTGGLHVPEFLPEVQCLAEFSSILPSSCLTIVWFQNEFGPPIDPAILQAIQLLDWDSLASEVDPEY